MKHTLCFFAGLLTLSFLPAAVAEVKTFPAKDPVIQYVVPEKWISEVDSADGDLAILSDDKRVSANFGEVSVAATKEIFTAMLPDMLKGFKDTKEVEPVTEQIPDGLKGFSTSYVGTIGVSPVVIIVVLFKAGPDRSILGNIVIIENPTTFPKEQKEKIAGFMKSLRGIAK